MEFKKPDRYSKAGPRKAIPMPRRPPAPEVTRSAPLPTPVTTSQINPKKPVKSRSKFNRASLTSAIILLLHRFTKIKKSVLIFVLIALVGLSILGIVIYQHSVADSSTTSTSSNETVDSLEYQTILPNGKSISDLGGWKRVSPADSDPVYAYTDKIGDIPVNVSEQPLPKSFIGNIDNQVAELAKKFSATTKLDAKGTTVYVGTSTKGPQSAIFTRNGLLILIKSQEKIDDASWIKYTELLN